MKKPLNILFSRHWDFEQTHYVNFWYDSVYPILSKSFEINLTWVLYLPEKISQDKIPKDQNVIYIQDFDDAIKIVETLKPDLIISNEFPSLIDLAFLTASNHANLIFINKNFYSTLPNVNPTLTSFENSKPTPFLYSISTLFGVYNMYKPNKYRHITTHKIKFLLYKLNFLLKTLLKSNLKFKDKWNIFSSGIIYLITQKTPYVNSKLNIDLELCINQSVYDLLVKNNYSQSKISLVGEPIFDEFFKKRNFKKINNKKISVLIVPTSFNSISTQKFREKSLQLICKTVSKNNEYHAALKIHPSSQDLSYYKKVLKDIDEPFLIYSKGGVESYVESCDVFVTFTRFTSAMIYPLILRKPVLICNFFNDRLPDYIEQIAFVCNSPSELSNSIMNALKTNHTKYENIDKYLKHACFKTDGLASTRICDSIISMMEKKSN
jgi:hypothetical protein